MIMLKCCKACKPAPFITAIVRRSGYRVWSASSRRLQAELVVAFSFLSKDFLANFQQTVLTYWRKSKSHVLKINTGMHFQTRISDTKRSGLCCCWWQICCFQLQVPDKGGTSSLTWEGTAGPPPSPGLPEFPLLLVLEIPLIKHLDLNSTLEDKRDGD